MIEQSELLELEKTQNEQSADFLRLQELQSLLKSERYMISLARSVDIPDNEPLLANRLERLIAYEQEWLSLIDKYGL